MKTYRVILLLIIITIAFPGVAFAHVLKTDGSIGAIMHIDPDDAPIAQQSAYFFFEFKDKTDKFQPADCTCTFTILEGGKEIFTQFLFESNPSSTLTNASVTFTFPRKDVYQVKVTGTPLVSGDFQPFTLVYDVRVDQTANSQANTSGPNNLIYIIAGVLAGGVLLAAVFFRK